MAGDVAVGLGGFAVGAASTGVVEFLLERQRQRGRARAVKRVLAADLLSAGVQLDYALAEHRWWDPDWELPTSMWEAQREILASYLYDRDWHPVAWAFEQLTLLNALARSSGSSDLGLPEEMLRSARESVDEASRILRHVSVIREIVSFEGLTHRVDR